MQNDKEHEFEDESFSQLENLGEVISSTEKENLDSLEEEVFTPSQNRLHPLFKIFITHKIPCSLDINTGLFKISGFYKNGAINIEETKDNELIAIDKKGNKTYIHSLDDIIFLNFEHWKASGGKNKNYMPLGKPWVELFQSKGLVERTVTFTPSE